MGHLLVPTLITHKKTRHQNVKRRRVTHGTLMRFLPSMPSHMDHQHVLSFKRFLVSGTADPAANEGFLGRVDVVCVDVLYQVILGGVLELTINLEEHMSIGKIVYDGLWFKVVAMSGDKSPSWLYEKIT